MAYKYRFVSMNNAHMSEQREPLSERLKAFLDKYQMTQVRFAELASQHGRRYGVKVTQTDVSCYVHGRYCPKIDKLTAISQAMGFDPSYFCGYGRSNLRSKFTFIEARRKIVMKKEAV